MVFIFIFMFMGLQQAFFINGLLSSSMYLCPFGPPERIMLLTSSIWAGVSNWDIKTETLVALVHDALAAAAAIVKIIRNRSNRFKKLQEDTCWMFVNSI